MRLAIYPSNRCNMACRYCMVNLNQGPAVVITSQILHEALEWLMNYPDPRPDRNITFFGGEPLLHYALLEEFISFARARYPPASLDMVIVTNGYYLDRAKAAFFSEHQVAVDISLDGAEKWNDRYRIFARNSWRSVFRTVMRRSEGNRRGVRASMVVAPDTAAALAENVKFIHRSGFQMMGLGLNYLANWRPESLECLLRSLAEIKDYILEASGNEGLGFSAVYGSPRDTAHGPLEPAECDVVLGSDGYFYASHAAVTVPYGENKTQRTGSPRSGLNVGLVREILLSPLEAQRKEIGLASTRELYDEFFALMREFPGLLCAAHWTMLNQRNPTRRLGNMLRAASIIHRSWLTGLPFNDWAM